MLNIIIVEDEQRIVAGLTRYIDWGQLGLCLIGTYSNGRDALYAIHTDLPHVDIVISDIKMPHMSGIDLLRAVREHDERIRFIMISGHDEFSFAQNALKYGADDYILKPIDLDYLVNVLKKLTKKIQEDLVLSKKADMADDLKCAEFFHDLMHYDTQFINLEKVSELSIDPNNYYTVIQFSRHESITSKQDYSYFKAFDTSLNEFIFAFSGSASVIVTNHNPVDKITVLYSTDKKILEATHARIKQNDVYTISGNTLDICVSQIVYSLKEINTAYKQCQISRSMQFIDPSKHVVFYKDLNLADSKSSEFDCIALFKAIKQYEEFSIDSEINRLRKILMGLKNYSDVLLTINRVLLEITRVSTDIAPQIVQLTSFKQQIERMLLCQDINEKLVVFKDICVTIASAIKKNTADKNKYALNRAIEYIHKSYSNPSLSVDDVAQYAYISTSYFSALFKKMTGMTFVEYLTDVRIKKACELLMNPNLHIYEIAQSIGFSNQTYFNTIFKRIIGVTPTEYRS